jgi:hypothetical protein
MGAEIALLCSPQRAGRAFLILGCIAGDPGLHAIQQETDMTRFILAAAVATFALVGGTVWKRS